jgi:hypothetical protein
LSQTEQPKMFGRISSRYHFKPDMLKPPTHLVRALPAGRPLRLCAVRFSSHDAPQMNEPTGYLFGEKVCPTSKCASHRLTRPLPASTTRLPQNKAALGERLVLWDVWIDGCWSGAALLQTRHQVSPLLFNCWDIYQLIRNH